MAKLDGSRRTCRPSLRISAHIRRALAASGALKWSFDPKVPGEDGFKACCDVVNRGGSIDHGKYQQIAATGTTK